MKEKIYLKGNKSNGTDTVLCPLPSSCILFFLKYCQTQQFEVVFIHDDHLNPCWSCVSLAPFPNSSVTFMTFEDVPAALKSVCLPSVHQAELSLVRAGLCIVLRHIIKTADIEAPEKKLIDLLGFKQGSMRMCSEVSGWTKLCEVDLPGSIASIIQSVKEVKQRILSHPVTESTLTLPMDLFKLDSHFKKKCTVHNDNKLKRAELQILKKFLNSRSAKLNQKNNNHDDKTIGNVNPEIKAVAPEESCGNIKESGCNIEPEGYVENLIISSSKFQIEQVVKLPHGVRRVRVEKNLNKLETNCNMLDISELENRFSTLCLEGGTPVSDACLAKVMAIPGFATVVESLTFLDIEPVHTYSEGPEMTLADLILFVYVYLFLEQLDFNCGAVVEQLPNILQWMDHMVSLPYVFQCGQSMGWSMSNMAENLRNLASGETECVGNHTALFLQPEELVFDEDEIDLGPSRKTNHKAIKPEVFQAFKKLQEAEIKPCIGKHPRGENVTIAWDSLPSGIHPREGDVPEKRTSRKCQQLENLVTAVQAVAKPGSAIVDFCSGGGHLGIALAYLLPNCQVYLVENKEESLLKVCSRLKALGLTNVTLYQCNIDYFIGKFDVGVCLHACGSATDMVQELCVNAGASFVICPCCYGSIHKTHLLTYPRSKLFKKSNLTYKEYLTLGHAADQTEFNIALEEQGRHCMNLVDSDRAAYAKEFGYKVSLCSLQPLSCTPKNNLLVGTQVGFYA